ncbi:hypothetical protein O983_25345 [Mycobacterium avium 09-5983]|nr:hypothetical protein O983_25345 [Mycobacterium avium 09-5983]ETB36702.1 hypothetical protein N602_23430 [Mycobacterium avium subsp. hominissuis 10-5606]
MSCGQFCGGATAHAVTDENGPLDTEPFQNAFRYRDSVSERVLTYCGRERLPVPRRIDGDH